MARGRAKLAALVEIGKAGLSGVTFLVLARALGPTVYGQYVLVAAIAGFGVPLASLGYAQWVQPAARELGPVAPAAAGAYLLVGIALPLSLLCSWLLVLFTTLDPVAVFLVFFLEMGVYPIWGSSITAQLSAGAVRTYTFNSLMVPFVKLVSTIVAMVFWKGDLRAWGAVTCALGLGFLAVYYGLLLKRGVRAPLLSVGKWWRSGIHFALVSLASFSGDYLDKVAVSGLAPSGLGAYGAASRFGAYAAVPLKGQALATYTDYFELAHAGRYSALRRALRRNASRGFLYGCAVSAVGVGAVAVLSATVLAEYGPALLVLSSILVLTAPARAIQYAYGDAMYALGRPRLRLAISAIGAGATVCLVAVGAVLGHSVGAAVGSVLGLFVSTYLSFRAVKTLIAGRHRGD